MVQNRLDSSRTRRRLVLLYPHRECQDKCVPTVTGGTRCESGERFWPRNTHTAARCIISHLATTLLVACVFQTSLRDRILCLIRLLYLCQMALKSKKRQNTDVAYFLFPAFKYVRQNIIISPGALFTGTRRKQETSRGYNLLPPEEASKWTWQVFFHRAPTCYIILYKCVT